MNPVLDLYHSVIHVFDQLEAFAIVGFLVALLVVSFVLVLKEQAQSRPHGIERRHV